MAQPSKEKSEIRRFAETVYSNPSCNSTLEFDEDYQKIKYIKILINKLLKNKESNIRLLLNHIICFDNVFPGSTSLFILLSECNQIEQQKMIVSIFHFLKRGLPEVIRVRGIDIHTSAYIENSILEKLKRQ
jgi:hypothetical protein